MACLALNSRRPSINTKPHRTSSASDSVANASVTSNNTRDRTRQRILNTRAARVTTDLRNSLSEAHDAPAHSSLSAETRRSTANPRSSSWQAIRDRLSARKKTTTQSHVLIERRSKEATRKARASVARRHRLVRLIIARAARSISNTTKPRYAHDRLPLSSTASRSNRRYDLVLSDNISRRLSAYRSDASTLASATNYDLPADESPARSDRPSKSPATNQANPLAHYWRSIRRSKYSDDDSRLVRVRKYRNTARSNHPPSPPDEARLRRAPEATHRKISRSNYAPMDRYDRSIATKRHITASLTHRRASQSLRRETRKTNLRTR